jgi:hypothetical protein
MDLSSLKNRSDLSFQSALAKKNALEKAHSRSIMAYNGCLFRADASTINLISVLKQYHKEFVVLDANENPCMITDADGFLKLLIERNQECLNQYHQLHEQLKKK